jgi:hypothetical protein
MDAADCHHEAANRMPDFKSVEEEAEFWDTHNITDFLDEMRPVRVRFSPTPLREDGSLPKWPPPRLAGG